MEKVCLWVHCPLEAMSAPTADVGKCLCTQTVGICLAQCAQSIVQKPIRYPATIDLIVSSGLSERGYFSLLTDKVTVPGSMTLKCGVELMAQ